MLELARMPEEPDGNQTGVKWVRLERLPFEPLLPQVSRELIRALRESVGYPLVVPNPQD